MKTQLINKIPLLLLFVLGMMIGIVNLNKKNSKEARNNAKTLIVAAIVAIVWIMAL